jgi:hypothetical protein
MSEFAVLERRYRRLLACYPAAFRAENEMEMLAVLMAGASDGQTHPRPGEAANLIVHGIVMRLRSGPAVRRVIVRLMYACTILSLLSAPFPGADRLARHTPFEVGLSWGVLALLGWAHARRHRWPRLILATWGPAQFLLGVRDIATTSGVGPALASVVLTLAQVVFLAVVLDRWSLTQRRHTRDQTRAR